MRVLRWVLGLAVVLAMGLLVAAPPGQAVVGELDLHARLHGSTHYPHAYGFSEYDRGGGSRDVGVTVHAPGAANRWVTVYMNYRRVGAMHLSASGWGHRDWETEHGQYVPYATSGDPVRVRTSANRLVVSGYYHRVSD